ncbi:hypothetical protein TWF694_003585 [Orbilia ellipsospora]|uniref:PPPDE domain-containing protein n=1 Tax=Orbilia ellipsospora TaxID=2528407 RepID=A0AAV9WYJ7_9PEZI
MSYDLYLATYDRGKRWDDGSPKPYHWSFLIRTCSPGGETHQLHGMPGAYYYQGAEKNTEMEESSAVKAKMEIGTVDHNTLDKFQEACNTISIEKREYIKWNCQNWALEALDELRKVGGVDIWYENDAIKNWFREQEH